MSKNIPNQADVVDAKISDTDRQQYEELLLKYYEENNTNPHWEFSIVLGFSNNHYQKLMLLNLIQLKNILG